MVNTTQFYKTKVALAVVLSLGLAACGDSEGDAGSTSTSQTDAPSAGSEAINKATGSIQGVVLDTNAEPVVGATVTVAGQTAVTDSAGTYLFDDVQVTNVAGSDDDTGHAAFVIVIQAPEGYASTATVNVTPSAQIDAENNDETGIPLTTFIDGFLAQAGTAVIPKLESSVEGYVRNDITGEPIANAKIVLDFTGVAASTASGTVNTPNGNVSLSGQTVSVTTDDEGHFLFEGVSNDSNFDLSISGYSFVTPATGQTQTDFAGTTAEQVETWVGTLTAIANTSSDTKPPFITSVDSSIGAAADAYNMLEPGFDGTTGIVFNISEAVSQTIDATNVSVWSETLQAYKAVASVEQTATTLKVTLTDAVASGEEIHVLFQMNELRDGAGNLFTVTEPSTDLAYTVANGTQTTYAEVRLQGHFVADTSAAITLAQTWSEATTDAYEDSDGNVQAGVNRLNSDPADSSTRMENRLDAEDDGLLNASGSAVVGTTATISVDQTAGTSYLLSVPTGAVVKNGATAAVISAADYGTNGITNSSLIIELVDVGDEVSVTPLDDFSNPGTEQSIELTDNVPATTALQESYGLGEIAPLVFGGGVDTVIDGGENSVLGTSGTAGDPLIYVTPRLLAGSDANWASDILAGDEIFDGLGGLPTADTLTTGVAPQDIPSEAYTADQWAAFAAAPVTATFGISFTEEVAVTGTPAWAGTATLTDYLSATDSATSNDASSVLVNSNFVGLVVTTNDVLTLGNVDANNSSANAVNFTDVVADDAGNNSGVDSKARVAFADALPPFVVSASLTVPSFTVVFNESIDDSDWETEVLAMTLQDDAVGATSLSGAGFTAADLSISTDGTTVTFDNDGLTSGEFTALIGLFSNGAVETVLDNSEADDSYDFAEGGTVRGHARLDFSGVTDAVADNDNALGQQTNSWSAYVNDIYNDGTNALEMPSAPLFMAWSEIPEFDATLNLVDGVDGDTVFTLTLTTGNGLSFDLDASFDQTAGALSNITNANVASGPLALTGEQVDDLLSFTTGGAATDIVDGSSSGLIAQGGTSISFSLTFDAALATNDQILFDNASLENANQVVDTLGRLDPVQAVVVPLN
ncbi:carboxypeptidase-like regulatory domain-containing protein [uncultured Paraglaciecola sp.]|uniref:beta strand repeat-containing protein n=1 Tax=uncultured Paraglaciecola sp. TaxID=1765024 RepID=UPI0030D78F76|tara:strand:- start:127007 stop:130291 length:3285 start_codon:yes stop_codon:yes gene_type:complete